MKLFRWILDLIRNPIVDRRIKTGRYIEAQFGYNAYFDMKRGGVLVKGYYDKPFSVTSRLNKFTEPQFKNWYAESMKRRIEK